MKIPNPTGRGGFKKGQSGNPGGRAKAVVEVRELARKHTSAAVARLVSVMDSAKAPPAAQVAAASAILDRGWGRPTQMIETPGGGDGMAALRDRLDRVEALARAAFGGSQPAQPEPERPTVQ